MDASKLEPQPEEGDINNNSETLDRAMLVSTHAFTRAAAHTKNRVRSRPTHSHGLRVLTLTSPRATLTSPRASPSCQAS